MGKYLIEVDLDERQIIPEEVETGIRLAVQKHLAREELMLNSVKVKLQNSKAALGIKGTGTPGRKPVNRPKIEQWIRENVTAGPSTQGTVGLMGVDKQGMPLQDSPNRVYAHRLAAQPPIGVGLSLLAIDKVLRELETEGYLERGFAAGAPFYELIRPLEADGQVGIRGRDATAPVVQGATPREVDFTMLQLDED